MNPLMTSCAPLAVPWSRHLIRRTRTGSIPLARRARFALAGAIGIRLLCCGRHCSIRGGSYIRRAEWLNFQPRNAPMVHFHHGETIAVGLKAFSATRNKTETIEEEAAD